MCWRCGWGSFGGDIGTRYHRDTQTETENETWTKIENQTVNETEAEIENKTGLGTKTTAETDNETGTETGATVSWHHHMPFSSMYEWKNKSFPLIMQRRYASRALKAGERAMIKCDVI